MNSSQPTKNSLNPYIVIALVKFVISCIICAVLVFNIPKSKCRKRYSYGFLFMSSLILEYVSSITESVLIWSIMIMAIKANMKDILDSQRITSALFALLVLSCSVKSQSQQTVVLNVYALLVYAISASFQVLELKQEEAANHQNQKVWLGLLLVACIVTYAYVSPYQNSLWFTILGLGLRIIDRKV